MGGSFTPVRGAGAAATPTVFFCRIADSNTMLLRGTQFTTRTSNLPALYANQCLLNAASFGAFTTAPDGTTNTMQLIVEDSTTGTHSVFAGPQNLAYGGFSPYPRMRLSGFFKAATRTRVALRVQLFS